MPNIDISLLRSDVLDRMDNLVAGEQLPEKLRQKLKSNKRVSRAMNQALILFVRDADRATVSGFARKVILQPDTQIGLMNDGVVNNVTTYLWPDDSFEERVDGGLVKIIQDEEERYFDRLNNTDLESVRYIAQSSFYGPSHKVFHVDLEGKRIYAPSDVTMAARIITTPDSINDDDEYGAAGASELPISDTFSQTLSEIALQELIKMGTNFANRERVLNDTMQATQPPESE